jgi:putative tricarboxylic transport membrane protein
MELGAAILGLLTPWHLLLTLIGTALGIVVGILPGVNGSILIALTLPLTPYMAPIDAMNLLVSMYTGSLSSGYVPATLLRIPGEPANVITTFDAYPMAKKGEAGRALALALYSSVFGALFAWVALATLTKPLSEIAVQFTPFNYFALVLMALVLIASISKGSTLKGLLSAAVGALIAFTGVDSNTGSERFTFGWWQFTSGFDVLPVLTGLFAVGTILSDILTPVPTGESVRYTGGGLLLRLSDLRAQFVNLVRSAFIGTWIGILPGIGAAVGAVVAYTVAKNVSREPEKFGRGSAEGLVAAETANNATVGGGLIPLIAMGIPGGVIDVFLMGALQMQGIQPGPLLFMNNSGIAYGIVAACLTSTLMMFVLMAAMTSVLRRFVDVPQKYLAALVLILAVVGVYASNSRWFEVGVMLAFGVFGFIMEKARVPLGPFVIAYILAPIAEAKLRSGLMMTAGDWTPLFTEPLSLSMLILSVLLLLWPVLPIGRMRRAVTPG